MLALFSVSVGGILWTQRATTESEIISEMRSILANVSDGTLARTESFLTEAQSDAALAAYLIESGTLESGPELEDYFAGILRNSPDLSGIFYGTENGEFLFVDRSDVAGPSGFRTKTITVDDETRLVQLSFRDSALQLHTTTVDPEDTYDPRSRPWYTAAVAAGGDPVITDPYVFFTSQEPGVTAAFPVFNTDGDVQGVVGVDVSLRQLSEFLGNLRLGGSGTAFIVNRSGEVIALEDQTELRQPEGGGFRLSTVSEIEDPAVARTFEEGIAGGLGDNARFLTVEGVAATAHVSVAPIGSSDWVLGVALSESDFLGEVRRNQRDSSLLAAAIGALSIFLAWLLIRNVTRPLMELRKRAAEIETGTIESRPPIKTGITELKQTSDAFDHMVAGLRSQRRQNELLLAQMAERIQERKQSKELQRANQALQQFAYMASHDLRAPLKKLVNLADLAVMDSDGEALDLVQPMRESAVHLEDLVLGYGRLAGIEQGDQEEQLVSALIEQATEVSGSILEIDLREDAVLTCDPVLITQLLVNLLENASKYGTGGDLVIDTRDDGQNVIVSVSNAVESTFPVDSSIFAPFRRLVVDDAGSGLGLAIVERIAHLHGGSVSARCSNNTFTIDLALLKEPNQ